jgi:hypothetical protein
LARLGRPTAEVRFDAAGLWRDAVGLVLDPAAGTTQEVGGQFANVAPVPIPRPVQLLGEAIERFGIAQRPLVARNVTRPLLGPPDAGEIGAAFGAYELDAIEGLGHERPREDEDAVAQLENRGNQRCVALALDLLRATFRAAQLSGATRVLGASTPAHEITSTSSGRSQ